MKAALVPALAGCLMLLAGLSPWLVDPLGGNLSAWQLPLNIGWQFPAVLNVVCNYGLLCLGCALYCFMTAWWSAKGRPTSFRGAVLLCLLPLALFLLQYLCIDMQAINRLAQREMQWLLINRHFGYSVSSLRVPLKPFAIDTASIQGRLVLLIEQLSFGAFLPCIAATLMLLNRTRLAAGKNYSGNAPRHVPAWRRRAMLVGGVLLALVLARAPLALLCEHEASSLLAAGDYNGALHWLDAASFLNPSLEQVAAYHIQRGQALYFQDADENSADSRVYLAFTYRQQNNDLSAYQELFAAWSANPGSPWLKDELTITLAKLAEYVHPLNGPPILRPIDDDSALPWLELLLQVDPSSVYGHYVAGRIQYDLHNYGASIEQMNSVASLSSNKDILSSASTYLALNAGDQQRFIDERNLLFRAVKLDSDYHNNTAREALSGLH